MPELMRSRTRVAGVALVCAQALIPLVFDHDADWAFVVPKALLGHTLALASAALLVALVLRFGRAALVWSPLHVGALSFLAACVIATVFAMDPYIALFGTHERMIGLTTIAQWVVLYFSLVTFVRTRRDAIAVASCALVGSLGVLLYEVVQVTGRDPYVWTIEGTDRAFSTTGQPTSLAQYTSTVAVAAFAAAILAPTIGRRLRLALLVLAAANIWGTAATDSRAPVVGIAAAAFFLVIVIWLARRGTRDARVAAFSGVAAVVALAALFAFTPIGARVAFTIQATGEADLFSRVDESTAGRFALYGIAIGEFLERPLVGYGPDNFVLGVARYRQAAAPPAVRQSAATSAHSWLVQTLATTGLLGTLALLATLVVAGVLLVRSRFAPVPLIAAAALVADLGTGITTIDDLSSGWIAWFCLGVIAASTGTPVPAAAQATPARRKGGRRPVAREPQWRRVAAGAVIVAGVLAMVTAMTAYGASRAAKASSDARMTGKAAESIRAALAAVDADPRRGEYWHTLGFAYIGANRFADARVALAKANSLTPHLAGYTGDLIQVDLTLAQAGDASAKADALDLANALVARDGNNPLSHYYRAQALGVAGDSTAAIAAIERALALDPSSKNVDLYRLAAQLYSIASRPQDAIAIARHGIAVIGPSQTLKDLRDVLDRVLASVGQPPDPRPDPQACTSTQWLATPSTAAPGTSVSFTIKAEGCPSQESQVAIQPPGGTVSYLNGGSWSATFTWNTTGAASGTYRVFLYTRRAGWPGIYQAQYEGHYTLR